MHELPVTEGILQTAITAAEQHGAIRITRINLVIGALAGIIDDSVQFYFDILSRQTLAEGATLHFRRQGVQAICQDCRHTFTPTIPLPSSCPSCAGLRLHINGGREFYIESIDIN